MEVNYKLEGLVTNIQDFSVHDGCGIRVIVFLKGCAMRCVWCQNPESLATYPEIAFRSRLCIDCNRCKDVCPVNAIVSKKDGKIDRNKCNLCLKCVEVCPTTALLRVGECMSVNKVFQKVKSYSAFFAASNNGGVTLSGGDPLCQWEYSCELIKAFRKNNIHVAIETAGYASYEIFKKVTENIDLLLFDIKHMDPERHKEGTGVSNDVILSNLKKIRQDRKDLKCVIRIPLIPGFNDDEENVSKTAEFVNLLRIEQIDLLPFNEMPGVKYKEIGKGEWECSKMKRQSDEKLNKLAELVKEKGLKMTIGGLW